MNRPFTCRSAVFFIVISLTTYALSAQETVSRYFQSVSEQYKAISDYTADLVISKGNVVQTAKVQYKNPGLLRMDFSQPDGMVMAVDNEKLQVWVPEYRVTFEQSLRRSEQAQLANMASSRGLELMESYYTVAYADSPHPVPIDPGSSETVVKLKLVWKSNSEGFRQLELSIKPGTKTIRRIVGITTTGETIVFDFMNIVLNQGIPDARFNYESPPTGNSIENFLFDPED